MATIESSMATAPCSVTIVVIGMDVTKKKINI